MAPDGLPTAIEVALAFTSVLQRLRIPHVTAGSFASSVHGEPRSTDDVDVVADVRPSHVRALTESLQDAWYASEDAMRDAVATGGSFNAVHLATGVKVDVFVVGEDAFDAHRVATGVPIRIANNPDAFLTVDTAEHTVLRKLEWFRRGGGTSDRQWRDILGILRTQGDRLDHNELMRWAEPLHVSDLLARALRDAS